MKETIDPEPREVLFRQPGEAIRFEPRLDRVLDEDECSAITDIQPFIYEGIGSGEITVHRQHLDSFYVYGYESVGEPVEPIRYEVKVDDVTPEKLADIRCRIRYKGREFNGRREYDDVSIRVDGSTPLDFWYFSSGQDKPPKEIYFARSEKFDEVDIILDLERP